MRRRSGSVGAPGEQSPGATRPFLALHRLGRPALGRRLVRHMGRVQPITQLPASRNAVGSTTQLL